MYFDSEKEYCKYCSDVIDSHTYHSNNGFCNDCANHTEECEGCGDIFHRDELINCMCENCYDAYRDELYDEDEY